MITHDEELDKLLPPGPCADCGATFADYLLDDSGLCKVCDIIADDAANKAERDAADAEDAALCKEGMRIWDKAMAEVQAQIIARGEAVCQEWEKQEDDELADRERAVKSREIGRRERRQDFYDADDSGQAKDSGEPLSAFEMPMDGSDLDLAPTALLQRKDGATLLYKEKLNFIFGTPGGGQILGSPVLC